MYRGIKEQAAPPLLSHVKECMALIRAQHVAAKDEPPWDHLKGKRPIDVIFFHGRADGDDDNLFELVAQLLTFEYARRVVISGSDGRRWNGTEPGEGWPGAEKYEDLLDRLGVDRLQIVRAGVDTPDNGTHTRHEAGKFIELAKRQQWKTGAVLTQPHQTLRAICSHLAAMREHAYSMALWPTSPNVTNWFKQVLGSQSQHRKPRLMHLDEEIERVLRYAADDPGPDQIATPQAYLEYVEQGRVAIR